MSIRVFHGTGNDRLPGLLDSHPIRAPRAYLKGRRAFSTTLDFEIAALFAVRRSPPAALHDDREVGAVLEYELGGSEGRDWVHAKCSGVLQDEQEIAVFRPQELTLVAIWRYENGRWRQRELAQRS